MQPAKYNAVGTTPQPPSWTSLYVQTLAKNSKKYANDDQTFRRFWKAIHLSATTTAAATACKC